MLGISGVSVSWMILMFFMLYILYMVIYTVYMHIDMSLVGHSVDRKFQCCGKLAWLSSAQLPLHYVSYHLFMPPYFIDTHTPACRVMLGEIVCVCNICVYMRVSVTRCEQKVCIHARCVYALPKTHYLVKVRLCVCVCDDALPTLYVLPEFAAIR